MRHFLIVIIIFLFTTCSLEQGNGEHFQSLGNFYNIELNNFNRNEVSAIHNLIDNKSFNINLKEVNDKNKGHTFFINAKNENIKYHFKVNKVQTLDINPNDGLTINIQAFINENGVHRRIFNPGNFKSSTLKSDAKLKNKYNELLILLIKLSYK